MGTQRKVTRTQRAATAKSQIFDVTGQAVNLTAGLTPNAQGMLDAAPAFQVVADTEAARASALRSAGLGFQRIHGISGDTFKDNSTIVIVPTRGMIHHSIVASWQNLMMPMNSARPWIYAAGHEVGIAYNQMIQNILANPQLAKFKYVLTLEDDNKVPADAHIRLIETIEAHKFDAVSGIYFTKGDYGMPMAYGDPRHYESTGELEFRPRDIRAALTQGKIMPVNGIAMGCALWRMDLFKQIQPPWFVTVSDVTPTGPQAFTQDLYFCKRARQAGKTFGVDMRVAVGHLDINTGILY